MIAMSAPSLNSEDLPIEVRQAASRRWRLFPVQALSRLGPANPQLEVATCDLTALERLASNYPDSNWGLATGQASGVFALEVDSIRGKTALHALIGAEDGDCEQTLQSMAGDTGYAYFRWPEKLIMRNKVVALRLKIRGENDFVLIPPSKYCSGLSHVYRNPDARVEAAPQWLFDLAFGKQDGNSSGKILLFPMSPQQAASAVPSVELSSSAKILPFALDLH